MKVHSSTEIQHTSLQFFQTFYGPTGLSGDMKTYTSLWMSFWHSYSNASKRLWSTASLSIFAPMWHHLYPDSTFPHNAKLRLITQHLLYLTMAYADFKEDLDKALKDDNLRGWKRTLLTNLNNMIRFFIPVVSGCLFF
jgi:hypothetical protein